MNKNSFLIILAAAALGFSGFYLYMNNARQGANSSGIAGSLTAKQASNQIALDITYPLNGSTVSTSSITIKGQTVPNADVSVNDSEIKADATGNFTFLLQLDEGDNDIVVTANDVSGASAEKEFIVTYTPPGQ